jgi:hypothetical protein
MHTFDWDFAIFALCLGYTLTVLIETPVLLLGLSSSHSRSRRIGAGLLLTAFTYPFVAIVFPYFLDPATSAFAYKSVSEIFAPLAECALFWMVFRKVASWDKTQRRRDFAVITVANLISFSIGELITVAIRNA